MRKLHDWQRLIRAMVSPKILGSAIRISLVVGTVLNVINQGEYLLNGQSLMLGHAVLNYLVPLLVASYSGAKALPLHKRGKPEPHTSRAQDA